MPARPSVRPVTDHVTEGAEVAELIEALDVDGSTPVWVEAGRSTVDQLVLP